MLVFTIYLRTCSHHHSDSILGYGDEVRVSRGRRGRTSSLASVVCVDRCVCKAGLPDHQDQRWKHLGTWKIACQRAFSTTSVSCWITCVILMFTELSVIDITNLLTLADSLVWDTAPVHTFTAALSLYRWLLLPPSWIIWWYKRGPHLYGIFTFPKWVNLLSHSKPNGPGSFMGMSPKNGLVWPENIFVSPA